MLDVVLLVVPRLPISTLFPYTTLFRSHQVVVPIAIALQLIDSRVLGCKETLVPCSVDDLVASKPLLSQPDPFLQEVMELGEAKPAQLPLVVVVVLCVREERAVVEDAQPADRSVLPHAGSSHFGLTGCA